MVMLYQDDYDKGRAMLSSGVRLRTMLSMLLDANSWANDDALAARLLGYMDAMSEKVKAEKTK